MLDTTMTHIPVDFSFFSGMTLADFVGEEAREGKKKLQKVQVEQTVQKDDGTEEKICKEKYDSNCLRINNNVLASFDDFLDGLNELLVDPLGLKWLDLSFNELTKIDACLCDLQNLEILYLYGNHIDDIAEVDKLGRLANLKRLSLHGNPMDTTKGYRLYVIQKIPQLRKLDFSLITKADRATAASFKMVKPQKKKKKNED